MHEMTVAQFLVETLVGVVDEHGGQAAASARVRLGVLSCVNPDALRFGFEALSQDTVVAGCTLDLVRVPARGRCDGCGWAGEVDEPLAYSCPSCDHSPLSLDGGTDATLESVTLETP